MFDLQLIQLSTKARHGPGQWLAEAVAAAGLLFAILRAPAGKASALVACYIGAAYWFTASTSFANPAAVFGRMFSDSFAGISPASAPGFVAAQLVGGGIGAWLAGLFRAAAIGSTITQRSPTTMDKVEVTIYHNPDCGTSRNTLAVLIARMGITARGLLRPKGHALRRAGPGQPGADRRALA